MPCRHARGPADGDGGNDERGVDRRSFMKSALVIGGTGALTTATGLYGVPETASAGEGIGVVDRLNRQHAWDAFEHETRGTSVPPAHHLLLHLEYLGDVPTGEDRRAVEGALRGLEETFAWRSEGLLFTLGYSPAYFERFDDPLPEGLREGDTRLVDPETTIAATAAPHEDTDDIVADNYDAVLHVASNDARKLLAAEAALWGEDNEVVELEQTFEGVFSKPTEYPARRTGAAGHPYVVEEYEEAGMGDLADNIPEESELSMGFDALYGNSVPREELATMIEDQKLFEAAPPGVFAQGTVEHVSKLTIDLDDWYANNDLKERRAQMLSPHHTKENTGTAGENLGRTSSPTEDDPMRESGDRPDLAERTVEDAENRGIAGHAQKCARARFDVEKRVTGDPDTDPDDQDLEQPVLRRDFDTTDQDEPGTHFVGLMRFNGYMHYVRQAMNGTEFDSEAFGLTGEDRIQHESIVDETTGDDKAGFVNEDGEGNKDNGIVPYLSTERRGNYLVPPITARALPPARALRPDIQVVPGIDAFLFVAVVVRASEGFAPREDLDLDTVRFGPPERVNRGGGAEPLNVHDEGVDHRSYPVAEPAHLDERDLVLVFAAGEPGFEGDEEKARLFAKTTDGEPVFATDVSPRRFDEPPGIGRGADGDSGADGEGDGDPATRRETGRLSGSGDADAYSHTPGAGGELTVSLDGPDDADFDLYLTLDERRPSPRDYDRRSWRAGSDERIAVEGATLADTAGVGILVHAYEGDGEYALTIEES